MSSRFASAIVFTTTLLSFADLSLAADCGSKTVSDLMDANTWTSQNYQDNYWRARAGLCSSDFPCGDGQTECSISIIMNDKYMLTLSRNSQDAVPDFSTCYDATQNIIEQCVRGESVVEGSWTLSNGEYKYSVGDAPPKQAIAYVPRTDGLPPTSTIPPSLPTPPEPPVPACIQHAKKLEELIKNLPGDEVCTSGSDNAEVWDDGNSQITRYSNEEIYLILAKTTTQRGFPNPWCWSKAEILQFISQQQQFCTGERGDFFRKGLVYPKIGDPPKGAGMYCLTDWHHDYKSCGNPDVY